MTATYPDVVLAMTSEGAERALDGGLGNAGRRSRASPESPASRASRSSGASRSSEASGPSEASEASSAVEHAATGADLAFVDLYQSGYHRLVAQLVAITGDVAEAEDVVQEAYVRAAQRWDRVREYDVPEAWVRRVAVNLALSSLRRATRAAKAVLTWGHTLDPGTARGPEESGVERLSLMAALRRLPMHYRAVLGLHYLADLDVRSIAAELSLPEATVKTRLARGRARLRKLLETTNDGDVP